MSLFTSQEMAGMSADEQAKRAISHTLQRIRDDKHIGYLCGIGTKTFGLLTEAAATLFGKPLEEVRQNFVCKHAEDPKAPQWISVSDELPDACMTVLVYAPQEPSEPVWPAYHDGERWLTPEGLDVIAPVTHWMDFPEPPKGAA